MYLSLSMWGFSMTLQLNTGLLTLAGRLGWAVRPTGNPRETCLGDYAHGYLLLECDGFVQVARRSERGDPSLKLWSPSLPVLQRYLAFNIAQLVRYYEQLGAPVSLTTDVAAIVEPFRLERDESGNVFLLWNDGSAEQWAGFGRGNEFVAAQVSQYATRPTGAIIADMLAPDAAVQFPAILS
ncbi:hypothetical protein E3T39_06050 [Cryobacterium suzukii]|uniref:Uncharacterized protein n=1 Tax=Cryobacterium suzukii TaxID=1259198 RepID=A0A4R9AHA1_9MICO|nr:hypothetical protein [Cryobacterium suzukii]TFD61600.1 hypothetical protein E3T39_06050 [Cryobacterium suzukii]